MSRLHPMLALAAGITAALIATAPAQAAPGSHRYLIEFATGNASNGKAALKAVGGVVKRDLSQFNAVAAEIPDAKVDNLRKNANIKLIEEDVLRYPISAVHSVASGADVGIDAGEASSPQVVPYGVPLIQADQVEGRLGGATKVCVIDSGYDITHEDKPIQPTVQGTDDTNGAGPWTEDGLSHGTHVSGTINALDNSYGIVGVFPSVPMHIVRVFGDDGVWAYSSELIDAVGDCMRHGANVINMSLGGDRPSTLENAVFLHALKSGVLSIAAAGNGGNGRTCDIWEDPAKPERQACKQHYPASYASVMSVAAVDERKQIADFSQVNSKIEVAAPGVSVLSTVPTGSLMDVTLDTELGTNDVVPMDNFPIPTAPVSGPLQDCGFAVTAADCGDAHGKICLIERGNATFAIKALSCEDAGGVGAIVFQNPTTEGPVLGTLGDTHVSIPIVGIERQPGLDLRASHLGTPATLTFAVSPYNYDWFSGTSMATPHVSGVAALLFSRYPQCGPTDVRNAIVATAEDLGPHGRDNYFGNGLVQAKAADDYLTKFGCSGQ